MVVALQYQVAFSTLTPCRSVQRIVQRIVISCPLVLCTVIHPVLRHHLDHLFRFQTLWIKRGCSSTPKTPCWNFRWSGRFVSSANLSKSVVACFFYLILHSLMFTFAPYVSSRPSSKERGSSHDAR